MQNPNRFPRVILLFTMAFAMVCGLVLPAFTGGNVNAAPIAQAATNIVISEFRTRGPGSASDEFVEIYNPTSSAVLLTGWKIRKSSGCGGTLADLVTIGAVSLSPGQHYLIGN